MKNKNAQLEMFLNEVKITINLHGEVHQKKFSELIETWKEIVIEPLSNPTDNYIEAIRNLHHLKLTIKWMKKTTIDERKTNKKLTTFFKQLKEYIKIEIKCTQMKRLNTPLLQYKTKPPNITRMTWTDKKRYLMELISALSQATCINNGKITLKELISCFSYIFNTDLSNFHSTVKRMTGRNMNEHKSRSFFLDELSVKFNNKLEKLDEN